MIFRNHKMQSLFFSCLWIKSTKYSARNLRGGAASHLGETAPFLWFERLEQRMIPS